MSAIDTERECRGLVDFARASASPGLGFRWLGEDGAPVSDAAVHTWITTRMTHVFALAHLTGHAGAGELAEGGVAALAGGPLRDREHGGWSGAVALDGTVVEPRKEAYAHAFVVLAASSATAAGIPGGEALLEEALEVVVRHFLDADGRVVDSLDATLTETEPYRGANSSMHMVEALLAAGDATGDPAWHQRALGIAEHLIHQVARPRGYLLPEHFTPAWEPVPDYNADHPDDPFRPFGCTPGHMLEWSRLLLHTEAALADPPGWLLEDAVALFDRAMEVGWAADGAPGIVYTVDWDASPVVRLRMHWVIAEALAAAEVLRRRTGAQQYADWLAVLGDYTGEHLIDRAGSWRHELDEHNRPSAVVWRGRPDVYHAYQAMLLPRLPLAPSLAGGLRALAQDVPVRGHS